LVSAKKSVHRRVTHAENWRLREDVAILRAAMSFFAGELAPL
jgi:hypothetical protein